MIPKEKILDDVARIAGGGVSILSGLGKQLRNDVRARIEEVATRLDLVPREDFERVEMLLAAALEQLDTLQGRFDRLEGKTSAKKPVKAAAKKPARKKAKR